MNTIGDIKNEVLVRLSISTTTTSASGVTDTILNNWLLEAYRWAAAYKKWPFTEGRVSTTYATAITTNEDGYLVGDYPEGWKSDSIRLLKIGGNEVSKKEFYKFTKYLEDNSSANDRIFSDYSRRFYINPRIDVSGTVTVWGQYTPVVDLTDYTVAVTVFEQDGNDAIAEEMLRYAKERQQKSNEAEVHHQKAKEILDGIWERVQAEQYAYQLPSDDGIFKRFDVLKGGFEENNTDQF